MSMYSESVRAFLRPILPFLDDPEVTEIMINGPTEIWIEKGGKITRTDVVFTEDALMAAARNVAQYVGRVLSDERPRVDARLPDGSRIHIVLAPVARRGTTIAIRKFFKDKLSMQRLIGFGAATPQLARLIEAAVTLKLNVIVAGGTGSGKTTLLNVVSQYIPADERILTIEDSAELQLQQPHIVSFESRPPDKFGKGEVSLGDLLNSALRLRPDRIVVGEVRGGECFHLLQAMNTGHGGSLATTHANTPTDTLRRLESLCLMSGIELPMVAVRAQVASAINLVICCDRLSDGSRKITHLSEVLPLNERGDYRTQDLFVYTVTGKNAAGKVEGYHAPTGILPSFIGRLRAYGFPDLDEKFFDPATWNAQPPPVFTSDDRARTRWAPSLRHREEGAPRSVALPEPFAPTPLTPPPLAAAPLPARAEPPVFAASDATRPDAPAPEERLSATSLAETPLPAAAPQTPPPARAKEPQPAQVATSLLNEETPRAGVEMPFVPELAPRPRPEDTHPGIQPVALADKAPKADARPPLAPRDSAEDLPWKTEQVKAEAKSEPPPKIPPKPAKSEEKPERPITPPPRPSPMMIDEPTIQISDDLLEEVERAVAGEATYVKRNPLLDKPSPAPSRPPPPPMKGSPGAPGRKRDEDEKTDPHIRLPVK